MNCRFGPFLALALLVSILGLGTPPASGDTQETAGLRVSHAWSRATPPGLSIGVAYFDIDNLGANDTLLRVESPIARSAGMHRTTLQQGMMQMTPVDRLPIAAHSQIRFEPDGLHVMLMALARPLAAGDEFPLTLVFEHGGRVRTEVLVVAAGADAPPHSR